MGCVFVVGSVVLIALMIVMYRIELRQLRGNANTISMALFKKILRIFKTFSEPPKLNNKKPGMMHKLGMQFERFINESFAALGTGIIEV
jgi:hypothetical protein